MDFERSVREAVGGLAAIACIDAESGLVVSAASRDEAARENLDLAMDCVNDLCTTPNAAADEAFVVGAEWMHVLVRAPARPELVVIGVAPAASNLALLVSCTRDVARALPR